MSTSTSIVTATRTLDGHVLPVPGAWEIDPGHADVSFTGRHFMVTKVRGRFTDVRGTVTIGDRMADSHVEVVIGMASVTSGSETRDEHLRSPDLFDVEQYPHARFRSTRTEWSGTHGKVHGELTIHGVTRPVILDVSFEGQVRDPWGGDRAMFSATTTVNREDFGITWNVPLETGGLLVSKDVTLSIDVETVLRAAG
jgi:polyisoprenoid-binding protein YceI